MSKGERDRARARRIVEHQKAQARRRTVTMWTSVSVVLVLVVAGLIGWGMLADQEKATAGALRTPAAAVDDGTAFAVGNGPVTVDVYEDFLCPICHVFENESGATLRQLATTGRITLRYHPIAILDRASNGTRYSTRSAAAAAAAAEGGKFSEYHDVLFANQPAEGSDGLDDARLVELGRSVGLNSTAFADAVTGRTYWSWAAKATDTASARGVTGTPTVHVDGKAITEPSGGPPRPATLEAAVAAAG
ncbi:DsbA family protein [Jidongwangia harbinensis]|uniref:DsbA family protein n=1 Tax=Jidongwangia harbinensis TaxID=2878561 RepID=UPI001CDA44AD|nr:thioredoxin domain-containing protein [Jidongwangia harbinensis]MCA2215435.1 DsbA family protein [Jidongwangia harbinensis]